MAVLDRDRKMLWGRAGNRCAMCKRELVLPETTDDAAAVIGDEAHIVARSRGGARFRPLDAHDVDAYDNLILLCKVDHKRVDDQSTTYSEKQLRDAKRSHEAWVKSALEPATAVAPVRVRRREGAPEPLLHHLATGTQVWEVIVGAQAWVFDFVDDHGLGDHVTDVVEEFVDQVRDYAEISSDVANRGLRAVRAAKRLFDDYLDSLTAHQLVVFGSREVKIIEGGVLPPAPWIEASIVVLPIARAVEYAQASDVGDADATT
jgi:5-methylcytosine-specific restriction endonuclease McrA